MIHNKQIHNNKSKYIANNKNLKLFIIHCHFFSK